MGYVPGNLQGGRRVARIMSSASDTTAGALMPELISNRIWYRLGNKGPKPNVFLTRERNGITVRVVSGNMGIENTFDDACQALIVTDFVDAVAEWAAGVLKAPAPSQFKMEDIWEWQGCPPRQTPG
jgi:hypothetical protein